MNIIQFHAPFIMLLTAAAVSGAAVYDIKWRRIPNFITLPAMMAGLFLHGFDAGLSGFFSSLGGLVAGGGILLIFYLMGGIGAGDVKLLAGVGALLGVDKIMTVILLTSTIGALMAIAKIATNGSGVWARLGRLGGWRQISFATHFVVHQEVVSSPVDTLPYGVAIALGTLITLVKICFC